MMLLQNAIDAAEIFAKSLAAGDGLSHHYHLRTPMYGGLIHKDDDIDSFFVSIEGLKSDWYVPLSSVTAHKDGKVMISTCTASV